MCDNIPCELCQLGPDPVLGEAIKTWKGYAHVNCIRLLKLSLPCDEEEYSNRNNELSSKCNHCHKSQALAKCREPSCQKTYHLSCILPAKGHIEFEKLVICCKDHTLRKSTKRLGDCCKCNKKVIDKEGFLLLCCSNYLHVKCAWDLTLSNFVHCPDCDDKEDFQIDLEMNGVYIPGTKKQIQFIKEFKTCVEEIFIKEKVPQLINLSSDSNESFESSETSASTIVEAKDRPRNINHDKTVEECDNTIPINGHINETEVATPVNKLVTCISEDICIDSDDSTSQFEIAANRGQKRKSFTEDDSNMFHKEREILDTIVISTDESDTCSSASGSISSFNARFGHKKRKKVERWLTNSNLSSKQKDDCNEVESVTNEVDDIISISSSADTGLQLLPLDSPVSTPYNSPRPSISSLITGSEQGNSKDAKREYWHQYDNIEEFMGSDISHTSHLSSPAHSVNHIDPTDKISNQPFTNVCNIDMQRDIQDEFYTSEILRGSSDNPRNNQNLNKKANHKNENQREKDDSSKSTRKSSTSRTEISPKESVKKSKRNSIVTEKSADIDQVSRKLPRRKSAELADAKMKRTPTKEQNGINKGKRKRDGSKETSLPERKKARRSLDRSCKDDNSPSKNDTQSKPEAAKTIQVKTKKSAEKTKENSAKKKQKKSFPKSVFKELLERSIIQNRNGVPWNQAEEIFLQECYDGVPQLLRNNIQEFIDVNRGEKQILLMWNDFMIRKSAAGFVHLPQLCKEFLHIHGGAIIQENLYRNCILHFTNLEHNGLIDCALHLELVNILQKFIDSSSSKISKVVCDENNEASTSSEIDDILASTPNNENDSANVPLSTTTQSQPSSPKPESSSASSSGSKPAVQLSTFSDTSFEYESEKDYLVDVSANFTNRLEDSPQSPPVKVCKESNTSVSSSDYGAEFKRWLDNYRCVPAEKELVT